MRRQGPDPEGSRFGGRSRFPGASGADRRLRGLRKEDRSPGAEGPGRTPPRDRHAGSGSEPSVRAAGARVIRGRSKQKFPREPSPLARVSAKPLVRPGDPVLRPSRSICRSGRRVTGDHHAPSRLPVPSPCRPAEAAAPAAAKQRSHEPRSHSHDARPAPQRRAPLSCEISVHKDAKAAQLIPSFLHSSVGDGRHAESRWGDARSMALTCNHLRG
jgi:hypothetical protein